MIDITDITNDVQTFDTDVMKAKNLLDVQQGALFFYEDWGIDLAYWFDTRYTFQEAAFMSYLIQKISQYGLNVSNFTSSLKEFVFNIQITFAPKEL